MVSSAARPLQDQKIILKVGVSGIGAATARAFARAGAAVGVNYRSKASAAEELVRVRRGPAPPVLTRSPKLPTHQRWTSNWRRLSRCSRQEQRTILQQCEPAQGR